MGGSKTIRVINLGWMDLEVRVSRLVGDGRLLNLAISAAMGDFWRNRHKWLPTWPQSVEDRAMVVYVSSIFLRTM